MKKRINNPARPGVRTVMALLITALAAYVCGTEKGKDLMDKDGPIERQLTFAPHGHVLTNVNVWSPDGEWIVYDVRPDAAGSVFEGERIERVKVDSGEIEVLYEATAGARCGVVTYHPARGRVVFILGPERPTPEWSYGAAHRQGVMAADDRPGVIENLDARDLTPPFTPGALRGGSHVHVWSPDGQWVSFTYQDAVLEKFSEPGPDHDVDQRNVGVSVPASPVTVSGDHPRNHGGAHFTVLVTRTANVPRPGSDEISKAYEDAWVGQDGYVRSDGKRQPKALAFLGDVAGNNGETITEVFIVDLPEDLTVPGDGPLEGTETRRPSPPQGVTQRRLTFTEDRKHPGVQGVRHWPRSSPDGERIAFLMRDDRGVVQLFTVSPRGGEPIQLTHHGHDVASAFTWGPDGRWIAHVMDGSVCVTDTATGATRRLTPPDATRPVRPEACVFSPDGSRIAFVRTVGGDNQVFALGGWIIR